jgi:ElaB/YqjD/DUF883 family membrane-anchored ribosome-binding protein
MNQLDADRLQNNLRAAIDNVEQALHHMADATGEEMGELRARADRRLHDAYDNLDEMEHRAAARLRRTGRRTQTYVHDHPWQMLGGMVVAIVALSLFARMRL